MNRYNYILAAGLTGLALLAAGCQKEKEPEAAAAQPGMCKPEAAAALVGKDRISDADAMQLTGATIVDTDFEGADVASTKLIAPVGLDRARNLDKVKNLDRLIRQ